MNANTITNPILRDSILILHCPGGGGLLYCHLHLRMVSGVQISHSRDFIHWETLGGTLNDPAILDLKGVGPSQGVWAPVPDLGSGTFYLVFTIVRPSTATCTTPTIIW